MKTRNETKNRHAEREFDVAICDLKSEFGIDFVGYDILDEVALAEVEDE
jgi:hypothetical protein